MISSRDHKRRDWDPSKSNIKPDLTLKMWEPVGGRDGEKAKSWLN